MLFVHFCDIVGWPGQGFWILPAPNNPFGSPSLLILSFSARCYLPNTQTTRRAMDRTRRHPGVDAIHPGYGFLSEREAFANACKENGITFVGPTVEQLNTFGDKTKARELAIKVR